MGEMKYADNLIRNEMKNADNLLRFKAMDFTSKSVAQLYEVDFRGKNVKTSNGKKYAGVLFVQGYPVSDDGLWDDGHSTADIKKNADVACRMAGWPKGWQEQSGEIDDQPITDDMVSRGTGNARMFTALT